MFSATKGGSPSGYQISRSVRLRSSASAFFNRTPASAGNRKTWTWSGWVKLGSLSTTLNLMYAYSADSDSGLCQLSFQSNQLRIQGFSASFLMVSTPVYRDPSAWYHIVYKVDTTQATAADRVRVYVNGVEITAWATNTPPPQNTDTAVNNNVAHNIGRNTRNSNDYLDGYLAEINLIDGQALTPASFGSTNATTGVWQPIKYTGTYGTNGFYLNFSDNSSRVALGYSYAGGTHVYIVENDGSNQTIQAGVGACRVSTISTANASYPSASNEYLVVTPAVALPISSSLKIYFDINYAWANGRNLYINGTQVSSGNVTVATVSGMQEWTINYTGHGITSLSSITTPQNSGGRAVFYGISIDGTTVVASANDWTPNNISVTAGVTYDSMLDVPTQWADGGNGRGNYAVSNPINAASGLTVSDGNLKIAASAGGSKFVNSSISFPSSGAYYAEITFANASTNLIGQTIGIALGSRSLTAAYNAAGSYHFYASNTGSLLSNGTETSGLSAISANEVFQVAVDVTNSKMWIGRSNVWYNSTGGTTGNPSTGANPTFTAAFVDFFVFAGFDTGSSVSANLNFGQRPFAYTPPSGFKALNTLNLPTPTILKGNQYFDATTYTGTGASLNVVNSGGMQPDFVWTKPRSTAVGHTLFDSLRGVTKYLQSNTTGAEGTAATSLTAFNSNGFTVNSDTSTGANGVTYVGWQWKEGATQGFDIVTYTGDGVDGRTVAHNLGVDPKMVIVKSRSTATNWNVKHASLSSNNVLQLNTTDAQSTPGSGYIGDLNSSTTFTLKNGGAAITNVNGNGTTYVAYVFAAIAGYSAFGSYTGNGSADGPFVFCGFRPRWLMIKRTDTTNDWIVYDSARSTYNAAGAYLFPNLSNAEGTGSGTSDLIDFTANGFKIRCTTLAENASGGTYIYAAFAENPTKFALAR